MAIDHSDAVKVFEDHFRCLEKVPLLNPDKTPVTIGGKELFAKPLNCRKWHELIKLSGMDYNIQLLYSAVCYSDGKPIFEAADLYRVEELVDGSVIIALSNLAYAAVISGVNDLKNGLRRPAVNG